MTNYDKTYYEIHTEIFLRHVFFNFFSLVCFLIDQKHPEFKT